jgi:hypothetical protein
VNSGASLVAANITQNTLNIASGSTVSIADSANPGNPAATSVLTDLNLNGNTGTLDLKNNDLILTDSTQLAMVQAAITNAYDPSGATHWDQPGLTSSSAATNPGHYGLGYAQAGAANGGGTLNMSSFDGQSVSPGTIVVKYTVLGDATLTGTVGPADYNIVLANFNKGTTWATGLFHPGETATGPADYNSVIANFNKSAIGNLVAGPSLGKTRGVASPSLVASAASGGASDMTLQVNVQSGDVSVSAVNAVSFTTYDIFEPKGNLQDSGNSAAGSPDNELLLSSGGTGETYPSNPNVQNHWAVIEDDQYGLAEGQLNGGKNGYSSSSPKASTFDTINIPAGGTIDFGDIYNTVANSRDLTFQFSETVGNTSGGDPANGNTYPGVVDYVGGSPTPEPGMLGVLGLGGVMMMRRRRRQVLANA